MLEAIEHPDLDALRSCFAPDASAWNNNDQVEQDVDATISLLGHLCSISTTRTYDDRRTSVVGSSAFLQHALTVMLKDERELLIPTMMRVQSNPAGRVERVEEYFDSRAVDPIFEAL